MTVLRRSISLLGRQAAPLLLLLCGTLLAVWAVAEPAAEGTGSPSAETDAGDGPLPSPADGGAAESAVTENPDGFLARCNPQEAQAFLMRDSYLVTRRVELPPGAPRPPGLHAVNQWRLERYGWVEGAGEPEPGQEPVLEQAEKIVLFGVEVWINPRIIPALRCVEAEIRRSCADTPYAPAELSGLRRRNTFRGPELSNHLFGIALDIDSDRNPCCNCLHPEDEAGACAAGAGSPYEIAALPECWVHAFERYGFHWGGRDSTLDTMHFEFLGDPERILRDPEAGEPEGASGTGAEQAAAP